MHELENTKVRNLCLSLGKQRNENFDAYRSLSSELCKVQDEPAQRLDATPNERLALPKGNDPLGDKNGTETKTHQVAWTTRHKPINPA
jgi:hypothetical protein